jgi:hypothetical protein
MTMVLSIDDIVAKFPVKTLPAIIQGDPDYESINQMMQLLCGNAVSLPTTLWEAANMDTSASSWLPSCALCSLQHHM